MSNRRLDISSLLCNDDNVLAHHPCSAPAPAHSQEPPTSSPMAPKASFLGLEALVHAATEERRRISGGSESVSSRHSSPTEDQTLRTLSYPPAHRTHQASPKLVYVPPTSSPSHPHSPTYSPYLSRPREHAQILHFPAEQRSPISPFLRQEEELQRYQYLQRQRQEVISQEQRLFTQRFQHSEASKIMLPPLHSPSAPFQMEEPEQLHSHTSPLLGRPRSGSFISKYPLSPTHIDMPVPPPRGSPRLQTPIMREHPLLPPVVSPSIPPTMPPSIVHESSMQSPRDFQPSFYHDTAVQHRQGSTSAIAQSPVQQRTSFSHILHQDTPLPFRHDSLSTALQPPVQQVAMTPQCLHPQPQRSMTHDDFPPSKRRRHSDSPLRLPALVHNSDVTEPPRVLEQRLNTELSESECGVDVSQVVQSIPQPIPPPIAAASGPTIPPCKSSHEGEKRRLLYLEPHVKERDFKVVSSLGRRSPPGSTVGRAKAAKKMDEMEKILRDAPKRDSILSPVTVTVKPRDELSQTAQQGVVFGLKKHAEESEATVRDIPNLASSGTNQKWTVLQTDKLPSPSTARSTVPPPAKPTSGDAPIAAALSRSPVILDKQEVPPPPQPPMSEEAMATLEQELEELLAEPEEIEENKMDVDVDHDVTQLVVETLDHGEDEEEADINKQDPYNLEADVDLELLRLVDDRPSADGQLRHDLESPGRTASPNEGTTSLSTSVNLAVSPNAVLTSSESGSMPPPSHQPAPPRGKDQVKHGEEKKGSKPGSGSKKKEMGTKLSKLKSATTASKTHKAKSNTKPKVKTSEGTATPPLVVPKPGKVSVPPPVKKTVSSTAVSRSRSASVMPTGAESDVKTTDKQEDEESSDGANDDDKLYCVCRTKYDEERFMIACDKCDEWYHMQCVNISDLEADLVDQFFCPICIESNPHASLCTTYKQRCLNGLKHINPQSSDACYQPALGGGITSKFCSQDCGVEYMANRIDAWVKKGGKREKLWESVKHAEKREGIVIEVARKKPRVAEVVVKTEDVKSFTIDSQIKEESKVKATKSLMEIERLKNFLSHIVKMREEIKKGMEVVLWREKLLELATDRAQIVGQCGWDQRLCFGDEEWSEFGIGVLESYETSAAKAGNDMQVDGTGVSEDGEWWCPGKTICDRHAGWQNIRAKDITKEKEQKEEALAILTTRERELRKRIEDLVDPSNREIKDTPIKKPIKLSNSNGRSRTGHFVQKGKKRKNIVH